MEQSYLKRIMVLVLGITILSFGIGLIIKADLGCDAYTTLNLGISGTMHISYAIVQIVLNFIILAFIVVVDKSFINIGTIINLLAVGLLIEFYNTLINTLIPYELGFMTRILFLIIGCIIVSFGVGMYIAPNLGAGPYDILPLILEKSKNWPYKWIRITLDVSCSIVGFLLGATIGVGTVIVALCLGPGIEYSRSFVVRFILKEKSV